MALWNFTIYDTSPYLTYSPFGVYLLVVQCHLHVLLHDINTCVILLPVDGPGGWRTWYTQSYYNTVHDQVGQGYSYHIASQINVNVTLSFYGEFKSNIRRMHAQTRIVIGTGIALLGTANSTFNITVDNVPRLSANSTPISLNDTPALLYSDYNFAKGLHYCASNL